jgi:hypothetical protein
MRPVHRTLVSILGFALALVSAGAAAAQTPNIRVAGRVQTQFVATDGDSSSGYRPDLVASSGFEIRRLRIQADIRIGENVNMVLQPSFEMGALRLRDAYLRVAVARSATTQFGVTLGQEKRPFSRYELNTSNNLPSIERGARFRGFTTAQNSVAAQNNLLEYNGYIAHDIGANADLSLAGGRWVFKAGLYNGSGESAQDVNGSKSYGLRAIGTLIQDEEARPMLRVGGSLFSRDRGVGTVAGTTVTFLPDSSHRSTAFGLDAEWGDYRPGLHVIADFAMGEHLDPAFAASGSPRNNGNVRANIGDSAYTTFASIQLVGAWRWQLDDPTGNRLFKIIEPALRLDVTDVDVDTGDNRSMLITPVLNLYFSQTTILRIGYDLYRYYDANAAEQTVTGLRVSWQANF